jgi:hypothetical protein
MKVFLLWSIANIAMCACEATHGNGWSSAQTADELSQAALAANALIKKMNDDLIFSDVATARNMVSASHFRATEAQVPKRLLYLHGFLSSLRAVALACNHCNSSKRPGAF